MATQFIMHKTYETNIELCAKGIRIINLLTQRIKSLSKSIAMQRQRHSIKMIETVATTEDPCKFLHSKRVKQKLHSAKRNLIQKLNGKNDIKLITAYAAAKIIYTNSQRSGVIQNLTIEEYDMRTINVLSHVLIIRLDLKDGHFNLITR